MAPVESSIDDLYKRPLSEFVAERTRLAKTLTGPEAQRVKALKKPTVVPWAVNQVYWHARPVYDRLAKSGAALRSAQVAALSGRPANVRGANEAHRKAISEAVAEGMRLASRADAHPGADELARMFESVSLTPDPPELPGRLVQPFAPPGFEALAGIAIKPVARERPAYCAGRVCAFRSAFTPDSCHTCASRARRGNQGARTQAGRGRASEESGHSEGGDRPAPRHCG